MKQKTFLVVLLILIFQMINYSQRLNLVPNENRFEVESINSSKILSGEIFLSLDEKNHMRILNPGLKNDEYDKILLTLYFDEQPHPDQIRTLENDGIKLYTQSWVPPLANHPYGFLIAEVPLEEFNNLLSKNYIIKVGPAETKHEIKNNNGTSIIKANLVWQQGWTGTGVKVAVLDSGLDTEPANADLPSTIEKRDYSNYPTSIDNNVENLLTGHGTHVTGSVLGRGTLSAANTINGGGPYSGSAPGADLVFLKIGNDVNSSATSAAMIAAMQAAVDTFNAKVITMSYGSWYAHHDGSSAEEQTVDWAYSQGVSVFMSAGNEGNKGRHYSGTVNANSETGFIQINVTGAGAGNTALYFNLVWADGANNNNLTLNYYNSSFNPLPNILTYSTTESVRGTESQYSLYNVYLPAGNGTYYLKVVNPSNVDQDFHIYDVWGARVTFQNADPFYTVGQPSSADNGFSVGAFTTRTSWTASNGMTYNLTGGGTLFDIAPFSSRGPRIDGLTKPNITSPGTVIVSIRDRDVYTVSSTSWIDNDGIPGGDANYFVMQGTSMATPMAAGTAALILQRYPTVTPAMIFSALQDYSATDAFTGSVPNYTWGYGKIDINEVMTNSGLPVELSSLTASVSELNVVLNWRTETEINNYGFEVQRISDEAMLLKEQWESVGFVDGNGNSNSPVEYSFTDRVNHSGKISYRLKQIDSDGKYEFSKIVEVNVGQPNKFVLGQNYPNPFNPSTIIKYSLPTESEINIEVFNTLGQKVATLIKANQSAGSYESKFDASNLTSGIYFYTLSARSLKNSETFKETRKMLLLR